MLSAGPYPLPGPRLEAPSVRPAEMVVGLNPRGISPSRVRAPPVAGPSPQPCLQPKIGLPQPAVAVPPAAVQVGLSRAVPSVQAAQGTVPGPGKVGILDATTRPAGAVEAPCVRPASTAPRSPGASVSWHPLLHNASKEALAMARSSSFALPERTRASPLRGHPGANQTPPKGYRSPQPGHVYFQPPKATSFIVQRTQHSETSKPLEAVPENFRRQPRNGERRQGPRVEPPRASPRTDQGRMKPPPLQLSSLTTPPAELPAKLAADYEEEADMIGEGAFAIVRRLREKRSGNLVALKVVEKYPLHIRNMLPQLQREVRIQGNLKHRHILKLLDCVEDDRYLYMLLEHCPGGSLRSLCARQPLHRLTEAKAARYFAQILQGVEFMHRQCCVHRDLKEENMLLTSDDEVRICDFGWSAEVQAEQALLTTCGTPSYWPPEIFEGECQDSAVDLWALGTMIYELLVGHSPFWGTTEEIRQKVLAVDLRYPPNLLSNEAVQVFQGLLQRDPRRRTPARALLEEDPWVARALEPKTPAEGTRSRKAFTPPAPRIGASMIDTTISKIQEVKTETTDQREYVATRSGMLTQLPAQVVAPIIRPPPALALPSPAPLSAALPNSMPNIFLQEQVCMGPGLESAVFRQGPIVPRPGLYPALLPFQPSKMAAAPPPLRLLQPSSAGFALGTAR
mmetsp:Transcript_27896/g.64838  ORF Transcript_27896/g.64838 Transcript_27896/m.64838 type:complete len:681 (+) Transcript_27896:50-2092(+)